ncbi:MAG: ABC transporter substrate-binding protein [Desulfovibrionales bacterium]|nr:ABC transporter substrate-binding protein [Desulfovibrionales bacterium]
MKNCVNYSFKLVILLLIVFSFFTVSGCTKDKPAHVRIAYLPSSSCLPLFVAVEKGYFKEAGVDVELLKFGATNDALNAVLAGRADGTPGFGISSFCAIEAKTPGSLKIYMPCAEDEHNYANNLLVPVKSPIQSIEQLSGKKVGTFTSSTQTLYLKLIMSKVLPAGKEWQIVQVDDKLQLQALTANQFDALFAIEPLGTKAVSEGIARVLVANPRGKYLFSPFPAGANCFSSEFIKSKPDLATKVAQVFIKAVKDIRNDPKAARLILTKYAPIEPAIADKVGLYTWWLPGEEDWGAVQRLSDMLFDNRLMKSRVQIKDMLYSVSAQ